MKRFFSPDNYFWKCFDKLADVLILSLLWFICSLPVVTVGAASAALYDAAVHTVLRNEPDLFTRFFRTFRGEFKAATLAWLIWGAALFSAFAGHNMAVNAAADDPRWSLLAAVYLVVMALPAGVLSWLFPLLSRYEFTFAQLNLTALRFWIAHLPSTAAMALLLALCAGLSVRLLFPVCFAPCLLALADSFFVERAFKKHTPEQEAEEPGTDGGGEA